MASKRTASTIPDDLLEAYDRLIASIPGVDRKGKTMPYTAVNGNMFTFVTAEGVLALRLSSEEREAFLAKYRTQLCVQHGTVLAEYVEVPSHLLLNPDELRTYFVSSFEYASSLKPKPTKGGGKR